MSNLEGLNVMWSPTPSRTTGENLASQRKHRPGCWVPSRAPGSLCYHRLFDTGPLDCPSPLSHLPVMGFQIFILFKVHPSASYPPILRCPGPEKAGQVLSGESRGLRWEGLALPEPRRLLPQMFFYESRGAIGHAEWGSSNQNDW